MFCKLVGKNRLHERRTRRKLSRGDVQVLTQQRG